MARNDPQVNFRISAELKARLENAAIQNNRTITSELVYRLEDSFSTPKISDELIAMIGIMSIATKEFAASIDPSILPEEKRRFVQMLEQAATQVFEKLPKK